MSVRFATLTDLNICTQLDLHNDEKFIKRKIEEKEVIVFEDTISSTVVACLKFEYLWTHMPFIGYIVVDENYRNKGVARNLLSFTQKHLKDKGHNFLLSSTMSNAITSQGWHMKMGFEECGHISAINNGIGELFYIKKF
ncbi:GNAT family N-acetyltransferase [uncultured Clostridium sp.]|uniref:GNAT family N-acetyltransferase n=1 Tax=uncultured Clostridium sp. TaxID=59620 RepID=UPI00260449DF|nr:GNAT family N-acetyltransferase [uncultured Clostridium sp.]